MNDITALMATMKAAAEKATPGAYVVGHNDINRHGVLSSVFVCQEYKGIAGGVVAECHVNCLTKNDEQVYANAEFIAATHPANVLALVEALEKAQGMEDYWKTQCRGIADHSEKLQAQIEQWEKLNAQFCSNADADISALRQRIAELESRTVTVKLPMPYDINVAGEHVDWEKGDHFDRDEVIAALAAAGIQVIEGEQKNG